MATGGGPRFSAKRFAYDVLSIALKACGIPEESLEVTIEDKNTYPHGDAVRTVLAGTQAIAFRSRMKWNKMFTQQQLKSNLNDMQRIERYLSMIEESPIFQLEGDEDNAMTEEKYKKLEAWAQLHLESDIKVKTEEKDAMPEESVGFQLEGVADKVVTEEKDAMPEESAGFQPASDSKKMMIEGNVTVSEDASQFRMADDSDQDEFGETYECLMTPDLEKIRISLAFYSELILFLNSRNIAVDFGRVLDLWSRYFYEKIAVKHDLDQLLMALFMEDPEIERYLKSLRHFIKEVATPYGEHDVSDYFTEFSEKLEDFVFRPKPRLATIDEVEMEEAVLHFDSLLPESERQENPNDFRLPVPDVREVERLEHVDIEDTTPESDDNTPVDKRPH